MLGCFNPESSDIDFLVIVGRKLDVPTKKKIIKSIQSLYKSKHMPPKGVEFSVVLNKYLKRFIYPTPYELHFSHDWKTKYEKGKVNFSQEEDVDLAAHFLITKKYGTCLYGEPISKVFPDIPRKYYIKSFIDDFEWSLNNVSKGPDKGKCAVPVYAVLNFCRILAYIKPGLIFSKFEGGKWGLVNFPKEYAPLIQEALKEYKKSGTSKKVDAKLLKQFANYVANETASVNSVKRK